MTTQTVTATWINHDTDLVDVTLCTITPAAGRATSKVRQAAVASHGTRAPPAAAGIRTHDETIHTTANHPWLTTDRGWAQAGTAYVKYDDGLGRVLQAQNALSQPTNTSYSITCANLTGLASGGCYEQATVVDANSHQTATLADG